MIFIILRLFPKQKTHKHLIVRHMLHIFISQCTHRQSCIPFPKPHADTGLQQVIVINQESHGTLRRLNGNKFVRVWCMSSWLDGAWVGLSCLNMCGREILFQHCDLYKSKLRNTQTHTLHFFGHFKPFQSSKGWYWPTSTFLSASSDPSNPTYIPRGIFPVWRALTACVSCIQINLSASTAPVVLS